jgi:hypothetical protein
VIPRPLGLAVLSALLGACNTVAGIPDRTLDPHLDCSSGQCLCTGGFDDCDKNPANGCETDLGASAANCGACGHDCLGGGCQSGKCQPMVVASYKLFQGAVLAHGNLYIGEGDDSSVVVKLPTAGGAATPALIPMVPYTPDQLAANATTLFWTNATTLFKNPLDSVVMPTTVATDTHFSSSSPIAASDTHLYWCDLESTMMTYVKTLWRIPIAGGMPQQVTVLQNLVEAIVINPDRAYWSDGSAIFSVSHMDTAVSAPMSMHPANVLAIDARNIYSGELQNGRISLLPLDGVSSEMTLTNASPIGIAVDAAYVYWAEYKVGDLRRVPIAGGPSETLASGRTFYIKPWMAADDRAVYWMEQPQQTSLEEQVVRLAK